LKTLYGKSVEELIKTFEDERHWKIGAVKDLLDDFDKKGYGEQIDYGFIALIGVNEVTESSGKWIKNNMIWVKYYENGHYEILRIFTSD